MPERIPARLSHATALLLLLLASLLPISAAAQDQLAVNLTARAGFDGYCKENSWIPILINVENSGPDLKARLQVEYANGQSGTSAYGIDLDLPTTSRKEFFLYLYPESFLNKLNVNLLVDGHTRLKKSLNITCLSSNDLLVGLLAKNPAAYASLGDTKPLNGFTRLVQFTTSDLPDQSQGWEALDALVVAGADTGTLSTEQRAALGEWLAEGGKLLIVGGTQWQPSVAGLGEFLPLVPNSTRSVDSLSALSTYFKTSALAETPTNLATGQLQPKTEVLITQDGLPLLVKRSIGFGEVYFLAADPGLQPLSDWEGLPTVYSHLLGMQIPQPRWTERPWENYATNQALSAMPELGLPSFLYICGWLALYLALVGPANYFILRRLKRPELAWISIPGLVILFTGIAFISGFLYRGGRPTLNRLMVVQGWDGVEQAHAQSVIGIYSPNRTKYTLQAGAPFKFLPFGSDAAALQSDGNWLALQQGQANLLPETRVEIGGMKAVALDGSLPALPISHNLTITLSNQMPRLTGQIKNDGPQTIKEASLVTPGSVVRLGDIAPGDSKDVNIPLNVDRTNPVFTQLNPGNQYPLVAGPTTNDETTRRRNALLQAAVMPLQYNQNPANWGIYLLGWSEAALLPASVKDVNFKALDTSLLVTQLTPAFKYESQSWLLTPAMFAWEASLADASPYYSYNIPADGYILRFRPVLPRQFSGVKALTLNLDCNGRPDQVAISLWDDENQSWSQIEVSRWGEVEVPQPERFIGPGGEILLKLVADQDAYIEVYQTSLDLVVTP